MRKTTLFHWTGEKIKIAKINTALQVFNRDCQTCPLLWTSPTQTKMITPILSERRISNSARSVGINFLRKLSVILANSSTNPNLHKHQKSDPSFTLNATHDFSLEHGNVPLSSTPQVFGNGIMQNLQREQLQSNHDVTPHLPHSRSVHDKQFMVC